MERLQKVIAKCGVCSRRKAEELIAQGKVEVNGQVVTEMGVKVSSKDLVTVNGQLLQLEEKKYYCMNKPRYLISSVNDELGRNTVISVLPNELKDLRLFPVGRLDYDTKGVLLLTNDGEFMNTLVGPKSTLEKEYLVRVEGIFPKFMLKKLQSGVDIGRYVTRRCKAYIKDIDQVNKSTLVGIILQEGKYHQVKLMFEKLGFPVKRLTRIRFGCIDLEGLGEGEVRELTKNEVRLLINDSKTEKDYTPKRVRQI